VRVEALPVVGDHDTQPSLVVVEPDIDVTGVPMPRRIGERFGEDPVDRLLLLRRHSALGFQRERHLEPRALSELARLLCDARVQREPGGPREGSQ
jgi:hypothetical protein